VRKHRQTPSHAEKEILTTGRKRVVQPDYFCTRKIMSPPPTDASALCTGFLVTLPIGMSAPGEFVEKF